MNLWLKHARAVSILLVLSSGNPALAQFGWVFSHNEPAPHSSDRYTSTENALRTELERWEKINPRSKKLIFALTSLAGAYKAHWRYAEAEPLMMRAIALEEKIKGPTQLTLSEMRNDLAVLYALQGKYAEAEPLFEQTLAVREKVMGKNNLNVSSSLANLAELYSSEHRYEEAEALYKRSLEVSETALKPDIFTSGIVAIRANNLAIFYLERGNYSQAEILFKRSLGILDHTISPDRNIKVTVLSNYGRLLRKMGSDDEAAEIEAQAKLVEVSKSPQLSVDSTGPHVHLEYQTILPKGY